MSVLLSEHLPLLATAPDGIQKLRGLILELAVRGKLVTQDPRDEPASELLKRIAKERARLEAEGTCKKSKLMPPVGGDEQPFALPRRWEWVRFSSYALEVSTGPFGSMLHQSDYRPGGIPLVNPSHMIGGRIIPELNIAVDEDKANELSSYRLRCGDIVMARRGEVGRTALVTEKEDGWLCGTGSFVIRLAQGVSRTYVVMLFRASSIRRYLGDEAVGTTMVNLNHGILNSLPVALPPLAEQHRIVAKVDELMALCDQLDAEQTDAGAAHARLVETLLGTLTQSTDAAELAANWQRLAEHFDTLFTTESSLDAVKQTILQLAVMGKLVPQHPNDEPASELLKRIAEERASLVSRRQLRKASTVEHSLCNRYDSLPAGWLCTDIGSVAFVVTDGTHKTPKYCSSGIKFVSAKDIRSGRLSFTDCKFISYEEHGDLTRRCKPELGDILVSKSGSIGTVVRVDVEEEFSLFESLALIKFSGQQLAGAYLVLAIQNACNTLQEGDVKGVAVKHLHLNVVRSLNLALPPLAEQHRIVAKVDELMALCDRLKADLAESRARQQRLATTLIESALEAA